MVRLQSCSTCPKAYIVTGCPNMQNAGCVDIKIGNALCPHQLHDVLFGVTLIEGKLPLNVTQLYDI